MQNGSQVLPQRNRELRVLFVEDNTHTREAFLFLLKLYFEHIDVAVDGAEGLAQYQLFYEQNQHYYDLVITDLYMPNLNGLEMIDAIFKINNQQQFTVVSADNEPQDLIALINLGISNFLLKPISPVMFKVLMERIIATAMSQRMLKKQYEEITLMNEELSLAKLKADAASQFKSDFLANMSHEIRTPLNAINGFISLLKKGEDDPTKKRYIDIIEESSQTLLEIINDVLDISKIENGKLEIEASNFDPYYDLIMVTELFQAKAAEKNIYLKVQYNHEIPETLNGDVLRIKQVLSNLLSNAIKFTPENSKIKCVLWYKENCLYIKVKDYGIGIAKEKLTHIFDAFVQADSSTVRKYGGTGLGLSISYRLSKLLGGNLTVCSNEGRGSTFLFTSKVAEGKRIEEVLLEEPASDIKGKRVLLVEDNRANQLFMGIVLKNLELEYDIASDGIKAVEEVKERDYDLILMDENMPRLNGMGATKAIRKYEAEQHKSETPIISLTANAIKGDKERFLSAGMNDYISKPIDQKKLLQIISKYL